MAAGSTGRLDTERVVGLASPRSIGIVAAIALAAGLVPGVPGLVGDAPGEDAAEALPPAPGIIDVVTAEPVGPDDGLIRVIVTPKAPAPATEAAPDAPEADTATELDAAPDGDAAPEAEDGDPHHAIDSSVLSQLTDGAVLHLDRRQRPWALFPDGTRVPLFPAGDGERILAERQAVTAAQEAEAAARQAEAVRVGDGAADDEINPGEPSSVDVMVGSGVGHPLMDEIATLPGVLRVIGLGDGSYAVTMEDAAVLDGLDVEVAEDVPLGIGGEPYEHYQWALANDGANLDASGADPVPAQRADADIDGAEARTAATGRGIVVAVVDSGVDFSHSDLTRARWTNDGEDCTNGIDDDGNGFVDDCHGWDFAYEDNSPYNRGAHAHGTHVAGIVASAIDGQGVAGIAPDAEIMDLNVGAITASGQPGITMSAVARAIRYAVDNGADVINLSLGTSPGSPRAGSAAVESAIVHAEANGVLVVVAAGNDGVSLDDGPGWPAGYEMSNMITVGASTPSDTRAGFSNWGRVVDIFAPGELILSTVPVERGRWKFMSGTSQATPIVAAAAALLLDDLPGLPPAEVRARLVAASDRHDALMSHVADGVRLNAAVAVGTASPDHRLADVAVRIGGLSAAQAEAPVEAEIDIAVPADFGADEAFSWHASAFVSLPEGVAALAGHEMVVEGIAATADDFGSVDLGIEGSGTVTLATALPQGSYALMLEAVPVDGPRQRLGAPGVVTFTVGATAGTGPGGSGTSAPSGAGSDPAGGAGSAGSVGRSNAPGGGRSGADRAGASPSAGSPDGSSTTRRSGTSSGSVEVGTGGSGGGTTPASSSEGSSSGSRPVTVVVGGGGGGGGGSGGGGSAGSSTARREGSTGNSGSSTPGPGRRTVGSQPPSAPPPVGTATWAIDAVSPHYGPVGTSTTVQLVGRFPRAAYVWFGDTPGTVLVASDRMMVVLAPVQMAEGAVDVSLRRTGEGTVLTVPGGFTHLGGSNGSSSTGGASIPGSGGDGSTGGAGAAPEPGGGGGRIPAPGEGGSGARDGGGAGGDGSVGDVGDGGGDVTAPGTGDQGSDAGGRDSSPVRLDARERRTRVSGEVVDLGNGLRGVMVDGADPTAGVSHCSSDPCRI